MNNQEKRKRKQIVNSFRNRRKNPKVQQKNRKKHFKKTSALALTKLHAQMKQKNEKHV